MRRGPKQMTAPMYFTGNKFRIVKQNRDKV